ncbi:MAG: 16S rRNA (uracil(1498)-N(3))-methyltransferase [Oscillospiraceae bacterium]|jgi:16S rRNA (uracil1498-N3)-methyltransferase|nr:16S rRNA (uracil(1498)-N(3))-methyltransferase [Oscillospiraceae bacterium]
MVRFFVTPQDVYTDSIKLNKEDFDHIRSLRLSPDEFFIVCDGNNNDYTCTLDKRDGSFIVRIIRHNEVISEPTIITTIYAAYTKGDRLDYTVQKAVELGVYNVILYESKRCISIPNNIQKKIERLQRIAKEAAKQCGRGIIPKISDIGKLDDAIIDSIGQSDITFFCYEDEDKMHIKEQLEHHFSKEQDNNSIVSVSIITGPEGGFEPYETKLAKSKGANVVSLGKRVLRSETAPIVALTALMYHTDNL